MLHYSNFASVILSVWIILTMSLLTFSKFVYNTSNSSINILPSQDQLSNLKYWTPPIARKTIWIPQDYQLGVESSEENLSDVLRPIQFVFSPILHTLQRLKQFFYANLINSEIVNNSGQKNIDHLILFNKKTTSKSVKVLENISKKMNFSNEFLTKVIKYNLGSTMDSFVRSLLPEESSNSLNNTIIHLNDSKKVQNKNNVVPTSHPTKNSKEHRQKMDLQLIGDRLRKLALNITRSRNMNRFMELLKEDGSFADINYIVDEEAIRTHSKRLGVLVHYEIKSLQHLSNKTIQAFHYITYSAPKINSKNWWMHVIGAPSRLWKPIVLAEKFLSSNLKRDYVSRYFQRTTAGPVWNTNDKTGKMAGGNFGCRATIGLIEAYINGSFTARFNQIKSLFYLETVARKPYNGDGMRPDGCLHQHNIYVNGTLLTQIYNNDYGKELLKNAGFLLWLVHGTTFDFGKDIEDGVFSAFFECHQWLYRYKTVEPTTTGRFIDAGNLVTRIGGLDGVRRTLDYLATLGKRNFEVEAALHRYYNKVPKKKFALVGNRHFFSSDMMAHQRQAFMAAVRLLSRRTIRPETTNRNSEGYHKGDGFLTVMITGKELGSVEHEIFQVYDWARVPGTTCQYTTKVPKIYSASQAGLHGLNDHNFVGGVSNGMIGASTMVYARPSVKLQSKKSWFFFDDMILCMGSDINLPKNFASEHQVSTILSQVLYVGSVDFDGSLPPEHYLDASSNEANKIYAFNSSESKWVHQDQTGYYIMDEDKPIIMKIETKYIKQPINIFSLWIEHGKSPSKEKYAYTILPKWTVSQTKTYAINPSVKILHQSSMSHATCYSNKVMMVVLFEKGCYQFKSCLTASIEELCSNYPMMFILSDISHVNIRNNDMCPTMEYFYKPRSNKNSKNDVYSKTNKLPQLNPLKNYHGESYNDFRTNVIQVSIADPSQTLNEVKLTLKSDKMGFLKTIIKLPTTPRRGDSVLACFEG